MNPCRICQRPGAECGPVEPNGICIDCESRISGGDPVRVQQPTPLTIIDRAVELKMGADEIGKLIALHNGMEDRRAQASFQRAMVACQQELPTVVRDRTNPRTNSNFASLDRINVSAHPVYTKHGFYISFREEPAVKEGWIKTVAEIGHVDGHRQEASLELPHDGIGPKGEPIGGMNRVQGAISSGSYAQRVLICRLFNIAIANTDHDGEEFIEEEDAAEVERILRKIKMPAGQLLLWFKLAGAKPVDPTKPTYGDIRSIYKGMLPMLMDDLGRREKDFDRTNPNGGYQ